MEHTITREEYLRRTENTPKRKVALRGGSDLMEMAHDLEAIQLYHELNR